MSKEIEAFSEERQALDELYDVAGNIKNLKEDYILLRKILTEYEAIKNQEQELGCPLEVVGRLLLHKERYIYTVEKSKLTDEDFMNKHTIVGVSEFGVCILTTNCISKTEPKYYKWNEYKITWWLRKDKSE